MMIRYTLFLMNLLLLPMPRSSASDIDRYLESTTAVVAYVNLQQLDVPAIFEFIESQLPDVVPGQASAAASGAVQSLREAGATRLYATVSTLELTDGRIAVIFPTERPEPLAAQLDALVDMLPESLGYKVHVGQDAVLVSTEPILKRLAQSPSANRPKLISAVERLTSEPVGLALNVRDELRSAIADIFPESLPPSIPAEFSPKQLMNDIVSLQLTAHMPPELQVDLAATCSDDQSAQRTAAVVAKLLKDVRVEDLRLNASDKEVEVTAANEHVRAMIKNATAKWAATQQGNKLKRVFNAMHNFDTTYRHFPPRTTVSEQGQSLLSWRVFLLPYLSEQELYNQFHLDEPWDSEHNRKLVDRMPDVYRSMQFKELPPGHTLIQLPLLAGAVWAGTDKRFISRRELESDASATVCIVVAPPEKSTIWTKPDDLALRSDSLIEDLFGQRPICHVAMFDGSVQELPRRMEPAKMKNLLLGREE